MVKFLSKKIIFKLFLVFVVLVSYGQILGMYVWQDDNALFFKLAHIEGRAGYLGIGPFGEGPYKYTVTPYIPIYNIFGYSTFPYFLFNLVLILLTTFCVYKVFSKIIGKKEGRLAGFLYAAGYIASDGFIRLFNGPITNISVVLIALMFLTYWNYYKEQRLRWYLLSIPLFFLATELARARTHYLIGVVIIFELIFMVFKKPLKSILFSLLRLLPFLFIFYEYFIRNADQRSGQVMVFATSLLKGDFQQLYGFTSSLGNLIFPDWLIDKLFLINAHNLWIITPISISVVIFFIFKNRSKSFLLTITFTIFLIFWTFFSRKIFTTDLLNLGAREIFVAFLGGASVIIYLSLLLTIKKNKKLFIFLYSWVLLNLLAYSAYSPTVSYLSINRYLAHSFFALVGLFALLIASVQNQLYRKIILCLFLIWGIGNLFKAISYQRDIILTRSNPPRTFYTQLKNYLPAIKTNDLLYFDVAPNMQGAFSDAFSVAQMPETTAIAWRYGVDRYDLFRVTEFTDLVSTIKEKNLSVDSVHSFFYSQAGLIDTTITLRRLLSSGGSNLLFNGHLAGSDGEVIFSTQNPVDSLVPAEISLSITAHYLNPNSLTFPYFKTPLPSADSLYKDVNFRNAAFDYLKYKKAYYENSTVETSSDWQKRVANNLLDNDLGTAWQADRILWFNEKQSNLVVDLKKNMQVSRLVWVNAFGNNTPIKYAVSTSLDNQNWTRVKDVSINQRIDSRDLQVVDFNSTNARFVKMTIYQSLNNDSPGIAEVLVLPFEFSKYNISKFDEFLKNPFSYVPSYKSYSESLKGLNYFGTVKVYWRGDKENNWVSQANSTINVVYDGLERNYTLVLPPGGTRIGEFKISDMQIPGDIILNMVTVRYLTLTELVK